MTKKRRSQLHFPFFFYSVESKGQKTQSICQYSKGKGRYISLPPVRMDLDEKDAKAFVFCFFAQDGTSKYGGEERIDKSDL